MSPNDLTALLKQLPPELQQEVFDFASFLAERRAGDVKKAQGARVPGLQAGRIVMQDDFDEPLADTFWLGQER